jgi:uncharacterized protein YlxP (DUF503 family)
VSFVCLIEIELHLPEGADLKGKRKQVSSLKEQLRARFGASVAETDHHDLWQRAKLTAALVSRDARGVEGAGAALERHVLGRFPDGASCHREIRSVEELIG